MIQARDIDVDNDGMVTRTITSMSESSTAAQHEFTHLKGAAIMKICFQALFVEEIVWEVYISSKRSSGE